MTTTGLLNDVELGMNNDLHELVPLPLLLRGVFKVTACFVSTVPTLTEFFWWTGKSIAHKFLSALANQLPDPWTDCVSWSTVCSRFAFPSRLYKADATDLQKIWNPVCSSAKMTLHHCLTVDLPFSRALWCCVLSAS